VRVLIRIAYAPKDKILIFKTAGSRWAMVL